MRIGPFLPLLISRRSDWLEAWIFVFLCALNFILIILLAEPDLVAERSSFLTHENVKTWDKLLVSLIGISMGSVPLIAGVDSLLNWSPTFSLSTKILSFLFIIAGMALVTYSMIKNRFFSGAVRIQDDRGHQVISSGPYRWIRHPGYVGMLLTWIAVPFFLDSIWAIIPAMLFTILLVIRTIMEEKTLKAELEGYREYTNQVHYRLIPGIW